MRVALGTIEVSDDARKAIRKLNGGKGDATRSEVKDYLLAQLDEQVIPNIGSDGNTASQGEAGDTEEERLEAAREEQAANHYDGAPHGTGPDPVSAEQLPEPSTGFTGSGAAGGTLPSTGNLGQSGTPGGTI